MKAHVLSRTLLPLAMALPMAAGSVSAAEDLNVYSDLIAPTLEAKCISCHGPEKDKGKLRVDSYELLKKGGSEGEGFIAGDAEGSSIIFRMDLPLDDDEHMPPSDEPQLTKGELEIVRLWIAKGGTPDIKLAALSLPKDLEKSVDEILATAKTSKPEKKELTAEEKKAAEEAAKVAKATMEKVNATGASLMPVAQDSADLRFSSLNVRDSFGDKELASLAPVANQIAIVELGSSQVTDEGLKSLQAMTNLQKLYLENTKITDKGMDYLKGLPNLYYLNLYGTAVTDAGIQKLASLKNLKRLYLWKSKATGEGADKLKQAIPGLYVNLGWQYEDAKSATLVASAKPTEAPATKPEPKKEEPKPAAKPEPKPEAKPEAPASWESVSKSLKAAHDEAARVVEAQKKVADAAAKAAADAAAQESAAKKKVDGLKTKVSQAQMEKGDLEDIIGALKEALQMVPDSKALPGVQADYEAKQKLMAEVSKSLDESTKSLKDAEASLPGATKKAADLKASAAKAKQTLEQKQAALNAIAAAVKASNA